MNIWEELKEQNAAAVKATAPWLPLIEHLLGRLEDAERRIEELENTVTAPTPAPPEKVVIASTPLAESTGSIADYYGEVTRPATSDTPEPYIIRNGRKVPFRGICALEGCNEPVYSHSARSRYCSSAHSKTGWSREHSKTFDLSRAFATKPEHMAKPRKKPRKKVKGSARHGTPNGVTVEAGKGVTKGSV